MRRATLTLLLMAAASGCADTTAPIAERPALSFTNGPEAPSVRVFREIDTEFFFLFNDDPESGLLSLIRPADLPGDFQPCGGEVGLDPASLQLIFTPKGTIRLLRGRDVSVSVYDRTEFNDVALTLGLCHAAATIEPIAQGTADFVWHDTDASFDLGRAASSFGWTARGTVYALSDGAEFRFRNDYRGTRDRQGAFRHLISRIVLMPVR